MYLTWTESGVDTRLRFSRSTNGGNSFSQPPVTLFSSVTSISSSFIRVGDDSKIYITCSILKDYNTSSATFDLIFTKSTDNGISFSPVTFIDNNLKVPGFFVGQFDDRYVLKKEETNNIRHFRIYPNPSMAVKDQNIYITLNYREEKNFPPGFTDTDNSDLVLYRSTDNGSIWEKKRILYWESDGEEYYPNDADQFFHDYCLFL